MARAGAGHRQLSASFPGNGIPPRRDGWPKIGSGREKVSAETEPPRRARFSIISSVRRQTVAGLIVKDLFRGFEFWLVDEGLESSLPDGAVLATRPPSPEPSSPAARLITALLVSAFPGTC